MYLKKRPLNLVTASLLDSGTWKLIVEHKEKALRKMVKRIGSGVDTYLWYDNWIRNISLLDISGRQQPPLSSQNWLVSDIIDTGKWCIRESVLMPYWNEIQSAVIHSGPASGSGLIRPIAAWEIVRDKGQVFQFYSLIWTPNTCPKMSVCALRALQNKLLTVDFLQSIGVATASVSVLCQQGHESLEHLFFTCPFSSYIMVCV